MKKSLVVLIALVSMFIFTNIVTAAPVPSNTVSSYPAYGVTENGIYFISKEFVDKVKGNAPLFMNGPAWGKKAMTLVKVGDAEFYVFDSSKKVLIAKIFCQVGRWLGRCTL